MEILENMVKAYASPDEFKLIKSKLDECVMTDEALRIIDSYGYKDMVFYDVAGSIMENMESWSEGGMRMETVIFADSYSFLSESDGAKDMLLKIKGED